MIYIISDLHLGADNCQAETILSFLKEKVSKENCDCLILNGDVVDNLSSRLKKKHWAVLSYLRKISDDIKLIYIKGNHDGIDAEVLAHLIGAEFVDEYRFEKNNIKYLCLHGDFYDEYLTKHPILTHIADWIYGCAQYFDRSHNIARFLKRSSKTFLRCIEKIKRDSLAYCQKVGYDYVCCGHTHHAEQDGQYINCGCFTELPCHYVKIDKNGPELNKYI